MNLIHPRFFVTQRARQELYEAVTEVRKRHGLTDLETARMVSDLAALVVASALGPMLRAERHPDQLDLAADLE